MPTTPIGLVKGRLTYAASSKPTIGSSTAIDDLITLWDSANRFSGVPAGYTYFGQFLAHELVSREGDPASQRTRFFDLDSIYSVDPPELFKRADIVDRSNGCFRLGETVNDDTATCSTFRDLPRKDLWPLIPEPRNDDNLLLSQLHCLFLRFHNWTMEKLMELAQFRQLPVEERFLAARLYLIATLQRVTTKDYLATLSYHRVYESIFVEGKRYIRLEIDDPFPPEFTAAAMRFGHTMVRELYDINYSKTTKEIRDLSLQELFFLTAKSGLVDATKPGKPSFQQIPESKVVDWFFFFRDPAISLHEFFSEKIKPRPTGIFTGYLPDEAMMLDPGVVDTLRHMKGPQIGVEVDIVLRNLNAGVTNSLPSGQEVATNILKRLGMQPGSNELHIAADISLPVGAPKRTRLEAAGFLPVTPLWLYLLVEASEVGGGARLGPLGSLIVCEMIRNAIDDQQASLTNSEKALLTSMSVPNTLPQLTNMYDLIALVQGDYHGQPCSK